MKKVCFITPGHISTNPRLIKEASALDPAVYQVFILSVYYQPEQKTFDEAILQAHPQWIHIAVPYNFTEKLRHRLGRYLFHFFGWASHHAVSKAYHLQKQAAIRIDADLYIAHNLGALPVAASAAQKCGAKYAFDAEDFHRGEVPQSDKASALAIKIEALFFPQAQFLSAASQLIAEAYQELFPGLALHAINNVFSVGYQQAFQKLAHTPLKLFWFSQTIGLNRGIQDVLLAMKLLPEIPIQLTLVGNIDTAAATELKDMLINNGLHQLKIHPTVAEAKLFEWAAEHHVGLALERSAPLNRDICLTNKIFTYLLAGNAIIASDTLAQIAFITEYSGVGWTYAQGEPQALARLLKNCYTQPSDLEQTRKNAWTLAQEQLNWEMEQKKWLPLVEATLTA